MSAIATAPLDEPSQPIPVLVEKPLLTHQAISRRLLGYLAAHRTKLISGLVCGVLAGAVQTSVAWMVKGFIDSLLKADRSALLLVCSAVVVAYAVMGVLKYGQSVLLAAVAQRVGLALRRDIYSHLQNLSLAYFHKRRTGALLSTLTSDVPKLQNAAMMVKDVIVTPVQGLMILGSMIHLSPMQMSLHPGSGYEGPPAERGQSQFADAALRRGWYHAPQFLSHTLLACFQ